MSAEPEMSRKEQAAYDEALRRIQKCRNQGSQGMLLDLSRLGLTRLPPHICQLSALRALNLSGNVLTHLPPEIGEISKLRALNLSRNQLTHLPPQIGGLTELKELDLENNQLLSLPPEIGQLTALTELHITANRLTSLPPEIGQLIALRVIDLDYNGITSLPPEISQLNALMGLNLSFNNLRSLPQEISVLTALTKLNLYENQLTVLPPEIGQLIALTKLNLNYNCLTSLPPEICVLTALEFLELSGNQLTSLPPEIGQLTALTKLHLFNNQLTSLPPEIGQLSALTELDLSENLLTSLPAEIVQLTALTELYLDNNQLTSLPPEIRSLAMLKELFLHGNPQLGLLEDGLGPTWQDVLRSQAKPKPPAEILNYYFDTQGKEGIALREMKLIVVGWGKAGKTTLVKRLGGEAMDLNEQETHGIMICPLTLNCTDGDIAARVWDFGGQHVLHAMHEFFLTARSLYLLVIEQRNDRAEADAKYWLQLIRSYAPDAPVVVALNKSQGVERPLDKESLEQAYGPIVAWVATECAPEADCPGAEQTITSLRDVLTAAAEEDWMPEPRKRFPVKWLEIKTWLEQLDKEGKNYLDYEAFAQGCEKYGEADPKKQAEVAALMHDLGIAMNYARDERLRDTTVLRPEWLANGIYAVLRANIFLPERRLVPDAVLTPDKLGEIYAVASQPPIKMLRAKDYPPDKWEFLLRLMNLFQLSFPVAEDSSAQLCPALLRADPPEGTEEPKGDDVIRLRYEFAVVPTPLLPRFMVRTFSLIEQAKLWQRGVMLRYPGARARVWTTPEEKYVFVTVAGPEGDRAELLSIIRGNLLELFREYRDLQVTEQRWFEGQWVPRATLERFGELEPDEFAEFADESNRGERLS